MDTLLLTGFEPFDGYSVNPSEEVSKSLHGESVGEFHVEGRVLPLDYTKAFTLMREHIDDLKPAVILCCGQADRGAITIERLAVNAVNTSRPDNYGNTPESDIIIKNAPAAFFSNIDPLPLVRALQQEGIPAAASYNAGTYGCNWILYNVLHAIKQEGSKTRATFVHLPPLPSQAIEKSSSMLPSLPLDMQIKALEVIIQAISDKHY